MSRGWVFGIGCWVEIDPVSIHYKELTFTSLLIEDFSDHCRARFGLMLASGCSIFLVVHNSSNAGFLFVFHSQKEDQTLLFKSTHSIVQILFQL